MEVGSIIFTIWLEKSIFKNNVVNSPFRKTSFFGNTKDKIQKAYACNFEFLHKKIQNMHFLLGIF